MSELVRRQQEQQRQVEKAVRDLVQAHQQRERATDRREKDRLTLIHPMIVVTQEGQELRVLLQDISSTGLRLLGAHRLLGQKVKVSFAKEEHVEESPVFEGTFLARILWTREVGDQLYENGGAFLSVEQSEQ